MLCSLAQNMRVAVRLAIRNAMTLCMHVALRLQRFNKRSFCESVVNAIFPVHACVLCCVVQYVTCINYADAAGYSVVLHAQRFNALRFRLLFSCCVSPASQADFFSPLFVVIIKVMRRVVIMFAATCPTFASYLWCTTVHSECCSVSRSTYTPSSSSSSFQF